MLPLVDQTPAVSVPLNDGAQQTLPSSRRSMTSVDVLSVSSDEGDLGESDVGIDDIKEELYGPMVDHTPPTPRVDENAAIRRSFTEQASVEGEGNTVVGQAEKDDVENDIREDDAMSADDDGEEEEDDVDDSGWGSTLEIEFDNRSLLSGLPLPVVDETQHLVDHVPLDRLFRGGGGGTSTGIGGGANSTLVNMDASTTSSQGDDNVIDDDGPNTANFGPIVDHTPSVAMRGGIAQGTQSITTSVATALSGLERDLKEDDDMDQTTVDGGCGNVSSTGAGDDLNDDDLKDDPIVDKVPKEKSQNMTENASVRVLVDKDDDMTQEDTIVEDAAVDFGPIVDQTPFVRVMSNLSVGASMMAARNRVDDNNTATLGSVSLQDDDAWDHEEDDLDDLTAEEDEIKIQILNDAVTTKEENKLVDHIPKKTFSKPIDGSIMVLVDPLDAASEVDDADDDTAGNARTDKFGPVVDHTPAPQSAPISIATSMMLQANSVGSGNVCDDNDIDGSGTWFGASTLGGMSSAAADGSIAGDDNSDTGWDDDAQVLDNLASPVVPRSVQDPANILVDHVPSVSSPRHIDTNASMAVVVDPSIVSSQNTQDEKIGGSLFGAVVDHTPSVDYASHHSTGNSTLVTGMATNTKREDEMDETTWQGGVSAQEEGWDQDNPELDELTNNNAEEVVVDHVPERPESRLGDPSLIVAANPSEMSSQVEDLNQDENHFGPVVDHTPLEHAILPPAVGSTVVAMPSVLNDDLDEVDADEQTAEAARVPGEWEEQTPNPQSGNDTENTTEQLVDAVPHPPPPEQRIAEMVRDASSEMATVDDKSSLVPADDPKEDEFGPVVDHTPTGDNIDGVQSSNRRSLSDEVDDKKPAADQNNVDSVAPMCSIQSKEKEDGLDEDEFGPVVDQLPAVSSKSSLAPSKGGSTADAKATISEDDFNTRDGWDDDTIDNIDQTSPANTSHRASYSVTWGDNVNDNDDSAQKVGDSGFFTAEMGDSSRVNLDETEYYDPEPVEMNGWGGDSLNIADDDTPPSTPRPSADFEVQTSAECRTCSNADTTDCPCIEALIETNSEKDGMVGLWKTPVGNFVKIKLEKLLQNETSKRMLIEKESQALRQTIESLKQAKDTLLNAGEMQMGRENEMMSCINKWQETNGDLSSENGKLSDENGKLSQDVTQSRNENGRLSNDLLNVRNENGMLSEDVLKLESECTQLRNTNDILTNELDVARKSMFQLEDEKSQIKSREAALSAEISNLKSSLEKQIQQSTSDASVQDEIRSVQSELSSKVNECSQLNSQLSQVQEKLSKSEAQNFKSTKDLAKITKDHVHKISELRKKLDAHKKHLDDSRLLNEGYIADLKKKILMADATNQKLQQENGSFKQLHQNLQAQYENSGRTHHQELSLKEVTIQSLDTKFKSVEEEKIQLSDQIKNYAQQVERFSSNSVEHESISREREVLKEALVDSKTYIAGLQKKFDDLTSSLGLNSSKPESVLNAIKHDRGQLESSQSQIAVLNEERSKQLVEIKSSQNQITALNQEKAFAHTEITGLKQERAKRTQEIIVLNQERVNQLQEIQSSKNLITVLNQEKANHLQQFESSRNQIADLSRRIDEIESEKSSVQVQFDEFRKSHTGSHNASALNVIKEQAKLKKMQREVQQLRLQLQNAMTTMQNSENERTRLSGRCIELESEIARLGQLVAQTDRLQHDLLQFQQANKSQEQRIHFLESNISEKERISSLKDQEIANLHELQYSSTAGFENQNQGLIDALQDTNAKLLETNSRIFDLESDIGDKNLTLDSLNEQISGLTNERDHLQNEKEELEEENEEMLVQFGLLNEEMVTKEAEATRVIEEVTRLNDERQLCEEELQDLRQKVEAQEDELRSKDSAHEEELRSEKSAHEEELKANKDELRSKDSVHEEELKANEDELRSKDDELRLKDNELRSKDSVHEEEVKAKEDELRLKDRTHEEELKAKEDELRSKDRTHEEEFKAKEDELRSNDMEKEELQNHLQLVRRKSQTYENQLHESEEKLNTIIKESEEMMKNVGYVDETQKKLMELNAALRDRVLEMSSEQSDTAGRIRTIESEKFGLNGKVSDLHDLVDELIASFETKEGKLQSIIDEINSQKIEMINKSQTKDTELARVNQELELSNGVAEESTTLCHRVTELENELSNQDRLLRQKDAALQDLHNQLENPTGAPIESAELEVLRQTVQDLDAKLANDKNQLQEMGVICDETQQELTRTMEQFQVSEDLAQQLQNELQSKEDTESTNRMYEIRLDELEQELTSTRTEESKHRSDASDLRQQVAYLEEKSRDTLYQKEPSDEVVTELEGLRQQVEILKKCQTASSVEANAREEVTERGSHALHALREQMTQKDDQIASMHQKLTNLSRSNQELDTKDQYIAELKIELEKLKSIALKPNSARVLELTCHQAENVDKMRSQIVSLAQALENSENGRAEVIEEIETERQAHAENLRRVTVNMKRFYSTLNR